MPRCPHPQLGTVTEADLDGHRVWRLEQSGVRTEENGEAIFCLDLRLDFDAKTYLPRAFGAADCGDPRLSDSRITTAWLDRDDIPEGFFAPETTADFESAP